MAGVLIKQNSGTLALTTGARRGEKRGKNQTGACAKSAFTPSGTSSTLGPLSFVDAISAWTPIWFNVRTISSTAWLGPPRSGPTEGMTWITRIVAQP